MATRTTRNGPRTRERRRVGLGRAVMLAALAAIVAFAVYSSSRGTDPATTEGAEEPATAQHVEGADGEELTRITMTEQAARRIDVQTATVTEIDGQRVVPSGAIVVDPDGTTWVYTTAEPLVFEKAHVVVDHEDGDRAFLTEGPPAGTEVVSLGAAELYGVEHGIGH